MHEKIEMSVTEYCINGPVKIFLEIMQHNTNVIIIIKTLTHVITETDKY